MKKVYAAGLSLVLITLISGCSDDGGGGSDLTGGSVEIVTKQEAENTVAVVGAISNMSDSYASFSSNRKAPSLISINQEIACSDGGSMTISGSEDDDSVDIKYVYDECDEYSTLTDGTMSMKGDMDSNYDIDLKTIFDYSIATDYTLISLDLSMQTEFNEYSDDYFKNTIDGSIDIQIFNPKATYTYGYDDFITETRYNSATYDYELDVNGKVSMDSSINSCVNGTYTLKTTDALISSYHGFSDGTMIVNNVTYDFQDNGTAIVTFENGDTATVSQTAAVVCE